MKPFDAVRRCLISGYATFSGRGRRSEFWWFFLFVVIANALATQVDALLGFGQAGVVAEAGDGGATLGAWIAAGPVGTILQLALFVPNLAASARRLHDTGRSGWWILIALVPLLGVLALLWWWTRPTERTENRFGPPPAGAVSS